jgi:hypothetical protein
MGGRVAPAGLDGACAALHGASRGHATGKNALGKSWELGQGAALFEEGAQHLWETIGTTGLEATARVAVEVLARHDIPHLLVGGLAGQRRSTPDSV